MPGRVLIVAPQIAPESLPWRFVADAARTAGLDVEWLEPLASENALRARLSAGDVRLVVLIVHGQSRGADHATIDLASSTGPEPRAVNVRHLAGLLAASRGLEGVVLLPRDGEGSPRALAGFAERLVANGAPATMRWADGADLARTGAWFAAWRDGHDWPALARLDGTALEHAGQRASAAASGASADAAASAGAGASAARDAATAAPRPAASAPAMTSPSSAPAASPSPAAPPSREAIAERLLERKRAEGRFDVFLCHNSADKPAVKAIARALRSRGVLPWLDEWELPPGQPWQPLLERQIGQIRSAAVFVGLAGVGPWQEQEIYGFLREFVARRSAVIPVLLDNAPSAPDLPIFLRAMTYVDFRLREPDPLVRLEWGITGVRPDYA
ncbi:MAG TPA: toll/interleukin-1 receptor domain-containing protein [Caldimonas sp.]|nr:toll/interleukin-1 receptor domain-containing protein [Caldimonas sp.]